MPWVKGQSGNPGGKKQGSKNYIKKLERGSNIAVQFLVKTIENEEAPISERVKASIYVCDRQWGRPKQQVDMRHGLTDDYADQLAYLAGITNQPQAIEGEYQEVPAEQLEQDQKLAILDPELIINMEIEKKTGEPVPVKRPRGRPKKAK